LEYIKGVVKFWSNGRETSGWRMVAIEVVGRGRERERERERERMHNNICPLPRKPLS
jgi:hypothetical protein